MMKSIAAAVAGIMFIMGVVLVGAGKGTSSKPANVQMRPSVEMLRTY
jgi:hypothetical protein